MSDLEVSAEPDFSNLPTVVWVKILENLNLADRYHTSITCLALHDAFYHPTLWRTLKLRISGTSNNFNVRNQIFIPEKNINVVKHFGKFVQNLTLTISGFLDKNFGSWNDLIAEVAKECRLESLTLEVGALTSAFHLYGFSSSSPNLKALVNFVKNAFRMKSLTINSWPMYPKNLRNPDENIFRAALDNPKLKELESLRLFWSNANDWTERMPLLLSLEQTVEIVHHFKHLKHLALRSPMLSEKVIMTLCSKDRQKMKCLQIFVNYVARNRDFSIPEISSEVWEMFKTINIGVVVEVTIMSNVPDVELSNLLKSSCPLTTVKVMRYARCDEQFVYSITEKFHNTLVSFESYVVEGNCEKALLRLTEKSPRLKNLRYYGNITCQSIEKLAEIRGLQWDKFLFLEKMIVVEDNERIFGEDEVISKGSDGEYFLVAMAKFHGINSSTEDTEARLDEMLRNISACLGYNWSPLLKDASI